MNGAPHTHQVIISESTIGFTVTYGDQIKICSYPIFGSTEKKMERVARQLIRHHDLESVRAEEQAVPGRAVERRLNERLVKYPNNHWGTSLLDER